MSKAIESITLHGSVHHPVTGNLGPKLSTNLDPIQKQADAITLSENGAFVIITAKKIDIQVPISNVAFFILKK